MTFEDLPPDWPSRPVTDPDITADLLDLVVRDADRVEGALCILLCGEQGQLLQPMVFPRPPNRISRDGRARLFEVLEHRGDGSGFCCGVLIALAREKGSFITDGDRAWHEAAVTACRRTGLSLLGVWVVTRHVIRQVPDLADLAGLGLESA